MDTGMNALGKYEIHHQISPNWEKEYCMTIWIYVNILIYEHTHEISIFVGSSLGAF
jgi:hypothetical protein